MERPDAGPHEPHLLLLCPDDLLTVRNVVSGVYRSATTERTSTVATGSVRKKAAHPLGSSIRIAPRRTPCRHKRLAPADRRLPVQVERGGRPTALLPGPLARAIRRFP